MKFRYKNKIILKFKGIKKESFFFNLVKYMLNKIFYIDFFEDDFY